MSRLMRRGEAYAALAAELGIPKHECHMKLMTAEVAERVPRAVVAISLRARQAAAAALTAPPMQ